MTGASSFGVSYAELQRVSLRLTETAAWLAAGAVPAGVTGAEPYEEVVAAVGEFDADWSRTVTRLCAETGGLGEQVAETSRRVAEHDVAAAASIEALTRHLQPPTSGPSLPKSGDTPQVGGSWCQTS